MTNKEILQANNDFLEEVASSSEKISFSGKFNMYNGTLSKGVTLGSSIYKGKDGVWYYYDNDSGSAYLMDIYDNKTPIAVNLDEFDCGSSGTKTLWGVSKYGYAIQVSINYSSTYYYMYFFDTNKKLLYKDTNNTYAYGRGAYVGKNYIIYSKGQYGGDGVTSYRLRIASHTGKPIYQKPISGGNSGGNIGFYCIEDVSLINTGGGSYFLNNHTLEIIKAAASPISSGELFMRMV